VNPDFVDLLRELGSVDCRYLIVGAYAETYHSQPRATGALDIWIDCTPENAERVHSALRAFGAPTSDLSVEDLSTPDMVYQIGVPPRRVDILTSITGVTFDEAWESRVEAAIEGVRCTFIGLAQLRTKQEGPRPTQGPGRLAIIGQNIGRSLLSPRVSRRIMTYRFEVRFL
jgi:hypothetical protein